MAQIEVRAEVTGKVWTIEVAAGAPVQADDVLLIVESMKMEIPVLAPRAGRVGAIHVAAGEPVEEGQVVAVIHT